jgi:predicted RNA binding protein YcfA (HicA-like mRNA interferase family)
MTTREQLLENVRRSPGGQRAGVLARLLERYGFEKREGGRHTIFRHELLPPGAVVVVPRHNDLREYVARKVVAAIDLVIEAEHAQES